MSLRVTVFVCLLVQVYVGDVHTREFVVVSEVEVDVCTRVYNRYIVCVYTCV